MGVLTVGLDVGQKVDPTAIAVVECEQRQVPARTLSGHKLEAHHVVRHLERLPLRTPYPQVGERVKDVVHGVAQRSGQIPTLYVDATGVGTPLCDALRDAGVRCKLVPCWFTFGDHRTRVEGELRIGKGWLVSRLQVLLQTGRLHVGQTSEADQLARELMTYEIKVDPDGDAKFGAFRVGSHDDLVTALGLATQEDHQSGKGLHQPKTLRPRATTAAWAKQSQPFGAGNW